MFLNNLFSAILSFSVPLVPLVVGILVLCGAGSALITAANSTGGSSSVRLSVFRDQHKHFLKLFQCLFNYVPISQLEHDILGASEGKQEPGIHS